MNNSEVKKWDMLAQTFDSFEIPKVEQDDCLKLIHQLNILNKDSTVLDLGCGAGRYSFAFANICKKVVGSDLSPNMISFANKRAKNMQLENISFICVDWDAVSIDDKQYENKFDFVFAHLTPAINCKENLLKMQACSKNWCMIVRHIHMETPILATAKEYLNLNTDKRRDTYNAEKLFCDLWDDGKKPYFSYFDQIRESKRPMDIELSFLQEDIGKLTELTPAVKEYLNELVQSFAEDGMVNQKYEVSIFAIYWQVK